MMKVPITKPFFDDAEAKAVAEVLASGWVVQGPRVRAFEAAVAAFTGAKHARATTSCTTALHLGLRACGVGPGDEVIVPAYTFVASANAVEYTGAKTVFADVDLETNNLDLASLERAMTPRTRAIMPVHQFGLACDMDPIMDLARAHNLRVVEDAACALGCFYKGRHVGTFGDAGCLSFHPRKSINTGEGGMVLANDPALDRRVEILRDHGLAETDLVRHQKNVTLLPDAVDLGYNYRMTDIQGAVGVEQVKKLPAILERKRSLVGLYAEVLEGVDWLVPPHVPGGYVHGYQAFVCLFAPRPVSTKMAPEAVEELHQQRNALMAFLNERGIATRQGTQAVHTLTYYRARYGLDSWQFPASYIADRLSLSLPLYYQMGEAEVAYVAEALRDFGRTALRRA